jgi:hypothetical protein
MIWVHGPRYLQAMYPDHETLARYDWFAVICALNFGRAVSGGPRYYGARALAGRSGRRTQVSLPESPAMRLGHCHNTLYRGPCTQIMERR